MSIYRGKRPVLMGVFRLKEDSDEFKKITDVYSEVESEEIVFKNEFAAIEIDGHKMNVIPILSSGALGITDDADISESIMSFDESKLYPSGVSMEFTLDISTLNKFTKRQLIDMQSLARLSIPWASKDDSDRVIHVAIDKKMSLSESLARSGIEVSYNA